MSRSSRSHAAWMAAFTLGVAGVVATAASTAGAQSTDSTRTPPPAAPGRMGMGPMRGMGPRAGADAPWRADDPGPQGAMRGRRLDRTGARFGPGARAMGVARRARAAHLLRGITLSAEQTKALRANQARHVTAAKPLMLELLSARTDQQLARLNGDQKALDAASARISNARARLDSLRENRSPVEDLRAVLTPEQQKLLDRNLSEAAQGRRGMGPAGGGARGPGGLYPGFAPGGFRARPLPPRRGGDDALGLGDDVLADPFFGWVDLDDEPVVPITR